ncbi:MAG: YqgE/AlgH family protein [Xanthomonadaceae bacterium]|jgi:putative transcriptional regulator|nr:YqgE/AlgH family protein [Xanthomonadaceae bacterium]
MSENISYLTNHLLIALPMLDDPNFARSVVLICQHDANGAMGITVNRASEYSLGQLMDQLQIDFHDPVQREQIALNGGPVHPERGFVLHDGAHLWASSIRVGDLCLTTSRDLLEAMAMGQQHQNALFTLGCAGWDAGQLEREMHENAWLTAPVDHQVLFATPLEQRWSAALRLIGVDPFRMTDYCGHV